MAEEPYNPTTTEAAVLESMFQGSYPLVKQSWEVEQLGIHLPLKEMVLSMCFSPPLKIMNGIVRVIYKLWNKLWNKLVPGHSPFAILLWHPKFQEAAKNASYQLWVDQDMEQFYRLGAREGLHPRGHIAQKIGMMSIVCLQYDQLRSLVSELQKYNNIFLPINSI